MGRQSMNQTEKNWLMDWQSTQKIKDLKSVILDQVAVVKPISGELLFIESPKVVPYPA